MNFNFESNTIRDLGVFWIQYKILSTVIGAILFLVVFWFLRNLVGWVKGSEKTYLDWRKKRDNIEFQGDNEKWENAIDDRVKMLDAIKAKEMDIRRELDKLSEVKGEKDKTNQMLKKIEGVKNEEKNRGKEGFRNGV